MNLTALITGFIINYSLMGILILPLFYSVMQLFLRKDSKIWIIFNILLPILFLLLNTFDLQSKVEFSGFVPSCAINLFTLSKGITLSFIGAPFSNIFMIFVSFLWILNNCYSMSYLKIKYDQKDHRLFFFFIGFAIFATTITAYSANVITMFLGYELLTFATLPLVTYSNLDNAKKSANLYLNTLMFSSIFFLFPAVLVINSDANLHFIWNILLPFLIVFGVAKAAIFPFHFWLPKAMVAPTPVSAMFHAVAVVKIGILCILKMVFVFSDSAQISGDFGYLLHYIAGFSAIYASLRALKMENLKEILAYSTLAQLSYMVMTICLWKDESFGPTLLHIMAHGIAKICLFFAAGAISSKNQIYNLSQLYGIGRQMPITMICFTLCALSIIGIPPLFGAFSKIALMKQSVDSIFSLLIFILCTVLNAIYLGKVIFVSWEKNMQINKIDEAPQMMLAPMIICTIAVCFFGIISFY